MTILQTKSKSGKDFFILYDDDGKIVKPVYEYLKHLCIRRKSKNTIRKNAYHLMIFWQYLKDKGFDYIEFAGKKSSTNKGAYENLTDYQLFLYYPSLKDKTVPIKGIKAARKASTVNQMLSSVICFYKFLSNAKIVEELPVIQQMQTLQHAHGMLGQMFMKKKAKIKNLLYTKEPEEEEIRFVTEEQFNICWNACTTRRNRIIIGLMFYGGLRVSEVIGLNLHDLRDIGKNIIHIKYREDNENPDAAVKNHAYHPQEQIVVDDVLRDEIISYITIDLKGIDTNYLIVNFRPPNIGGAMKSDTIRKMIKGLGKKVKMKLHPHMFRHGCAMRMLYAGMDMKSISDKLRHKSIETTAGTYAKYDLKAKIKAQEELAAHLNQEFEPLGIDFDELLKMTREVEQDE